MKISTISLLYLSVDNFCLSGTKWITKKTFFLFLNSMSLDRIINNFWMFSFQNESGETKRHLKFQNWTLTTITGNREADQSIDAIHLLNRCVLKIALGVVGIDRLGWDRTITRHSYAMHNNNHNCIYCKIMRVQSTWMCSRAQHSTLHYVHCLLRESSRADGNFNFIHLFVCNCL